MGGTLTLWPGKDLASQYASLAKLERMLDSSLVFCTLLGPEGPGRHTVLKDTGVDSQLWTTASAAYYQAGGTVFGLRPV